jgi:hypothetical protein
VSPTHSLYLDTGHSLVASGVLHHDIAASRLGAKEGTLEHVSADAASEVRMLKGAVLGQKVLKDEYSAWWI